MQLKGIIYMTPSNGSFFDTAKKLFVSFSGGETSALMTRLLLTRWRGRWDEVAVVFANTGQENEETLEFVDQCDRAFGFGTVWVESVVHPEHGVGTTHRIVTFESASRKGEPFEAYIQKFGIPNQKMPDCTRELKKRPLESYLRSIGWATGTYDTALGMRADEPWRRSLNQVNGRVIYPLMDLQPTTKPHVNLFWTKQTFRLQLTGYQGNCKWCWKKSMRKHMTLMAENPTQFDFPERMEAQYGSVGAEFKKEFRPGYARVFFRGNLSTKDLRTAYALNKDSLERAEDDSIVLPSGDLFPLDLEPGGCVESCEIDFEDVPA